MMYEDTLNNEVFEETIELDDEALKDVAGGKKFKATAGIFVLANNHPNAKPIGFLKEGEIVPCSSGTYTGGRYKFYRIQYKGVTGFVMAKHGQVID